MNNYQLIAKSIEYLNQHQKTAVSLDELATFVGVSGSHLQKVFTQWAGVSPKQFQRFLSLEYAKGLLAENKTMLQTSILTGLSGSGRLHDLFVDIVAMTPGEYKHGGENLEIEYGVYECQFGWYTVASTPKGVCNVLFLDCPEDALKLLQERWPKAHLSQKKSPLHTEIVAFFDHQNPTKKIKLHVHGTNFQLQVWQALLSISEGKLQTYGDMATKIGQSGGLAARAVGTAIGNNPIGYIIPCHRVLKSTGQISGYRWGVGRKQAMLGWEASKNQEL
jgi:AraC family transcriptional regulator, regulatory protein of adaptative response / methylated-DNA-[protein]-cysteine methyltransferase